MNVVLTDKIKSICYGKRDFIKIYVHEVAISHPLDQGKNIKLGIWANIDFPSIDFKLFYVV